MKEERFKIIDYGHHIYHLVSTKSKKDYDVMTRRNTRPDYLYVSVYKKIDYEGYISVFRDGDGYTIQPATETEISRHAIRVLSMPGTVHTHSNMYVSVKKEDLLFLRSRPYVHMHVVQNGSQFYIEAYPCEEKDAKNLPLLNQIHNQSKCDEYEYIIPASSLRYGYQLPISSVFVKKCGANHGDRFHIWNREDNVLVIEAQPIACDVCGKMINRYHENAVEKYVCQGCYKDLDDAKKIALDYTGKEDLMRVKEVLSSVRKMMENMLEDE